MNFLKRIFKKTPALDPIDLSIIGTDLHSHLIPGIDDGSKSMEDTLKMLNKFVSLGYKKVITTPHIMSDFYKNTPEIINAGLADIRKAIAEHNLPIEIEAAAEYYLDFHLDDVIQKKSAMTFGDNYVLFELSFATEPVGVKNTVFNMITEGYNPILAHVERYPFYHNAWKEIEDFKERGVLLQLNINSLSGQYGHHVKQMAEELIERDWIDAIGSDCHHIHHLEMIDNLRRNPFLHKIAKKENLLNKVL